MHFLHCLDSLAWKLFYMAGCFFVAAQNLEQWEVRCWTQEMRSCEFRNSWQMLIPAAPRTCSVQTDKLYFWYWGNPLGCCAKSRVRAIILSLHKHENVKLNLRVLFKGRLAPKCFVAFSSSYIRGRENSTFSCYNMILYLAVPANDRRTIK